MTYFKLPITYTNECYNIDDNIITDLELLNTENSLYKKIFNPNSKIGEKIINLWTKHYTTNTKYLEDTQLLIKKEIPLVREKVFNNNISEVKTGKNWPTIIIGTDKT